MRLFRPLLHIWHTLIANLFTVFFQEASKSHVFDFIQVRSMQVLDDVIGKVEQKVGNDKLVLFCWPPLAWWQMIILGHQSLQNQFGSALEMCISLLAHGLLLIWYIAVSGVKNLQHWFLFLGQIATIRYVMSRPVDIDNARPFTDCHKPCIRDVRFENGTLWYRGADNGFFTIAVGSYQPSNSLFIGFPKIIHDILLFSRQYTISRKEVAYG